MKLEFKYVIVDKAGTYYTKYWRNYWSDSMSDAKKFDSPAEILAEFDEEGDDGDNDARLEGALLPFTVITVIDKVEK